MEIKEGVLDNIKEVRLDKDEVSLVISNHDNNFFRVETIPYDKEVVSFSITSSFTDIKQYEVFRAFERFIQNIIGCYYMYHNYNRQVVVNVDEHYIAIQGDGSPYNYLKIEYSSREIIIRIYRNPKHVYRNNCLILDKEGALSGYYYGSFTELLNSLAALAPRNVDISRARTPKKPFWGFKNPFSL